MKMLQWCFGMMVTLTACGTPAITTNLVPNPPRPSAQPSATPSGQPQATLTGNWTGTGLLLERVGNETFDEFRTRISDEFKASGEAPNALRTNGPNDPGSGTLALQANGSATLTLQGSTAQTINWTLNANLLSLTGTAYPELPVAPNQGSFLLFTRSEPGSGNADLDREIRKPFFLVSLFRRN
jgi:hypothetical protein